MRNRKFTLVFIFVIAFTLLISGCASDKNMSNDIAPQENMDSSSGEMEYTEEKSMENEVPGENNSVEPDKIITTVYMEMQTKDFIPTTDKLNSLINKYKGYVENSNISYNDYVYSTGLKYANYAIRIPRENLEKFLNDTVEIGNIISQNKNKEDITKFYRDTESRLRVVETKEERILALLEKAEKMEDIIALENQLSDIILQKENLSRDITDMDDKVDYSTVNLNIEEVAKLTPGGNSKTPFVEKVKNAFKDSFYFFTRNAGELLLGLIYFLPYGVILAIIVYLVYRFVWKKKLPKDKE